MDMAIYVCDSPAKAAYAHALLIANGYPAVSITIEAVENLYYDGKRFSNGVTDSFMTPQWVVIGLKQGAA